MGKPKPTNHQRWSVRIVDGRIDVEVFFRLDTIAALQLGREITDAAHKLSARNARQGALP